MAFDTVLDTNQTLYLLLIGETVSHFRKPELF